MLAFYLAQLEDIDDKALFTEIYEENMEKMYGIAKAILLSPEAAKDAVHDTFIKIINNFDKFAALDGSCRKGWIVVGTRNTAINIRRKERRSFPAADDYLFNNISGEDLGEGLHDLLAAIRSLPDKYRDVLEMYYIHGYSYKEIAALSDISEDNAMQRTSRARKLLLAKLQDC